MGAMESTLPLITSDLARAGRALAQVSLDDVAQLSQIARDRLRRFERGRTSLAADETHDLRHALEEFGVIFLTEDDDAGYGVRQKYNSRKTRRLDTWENEGGPAYEDDI